MDTHAVDAPPAAATGEGLAASVCTMRALQMGQVRQASQGCWVWAGAVLVNAVAAGVTGGGHLSRIERQPGVDGELVVGEATAAVGGRRCESSFRR